MYKILYIYSFFYILFIPGDEKNKADINCTLQPSSLTPLHLAAERGKLTCLNLLLEHPDIQVILFKYTPRGSRYTCVLLEKPGIQVYS